MSSFFNGEQAGRRKLLLDLQDAMVAAAIPVNKRKRVLELLGEQGRATGWGAIRGAAPSMVVTESRVFRTADDLLREAVVVEPNVKIPLERMERER